jgi:hypothetical protein
MARTIARLSRPGAVAIHWATESCALVMRPHMRIALPRIALKRTPSDATASYATASYTKRALSLRRAYRGVQKRMQYVLPVALEADLIIIYVQYLGGT